MTDLSTASITWRGLTLHGGETGRFTFATLEGWEELPSVEREAPGRRGSHGSMGNAPLARSRVVRTSGLCASPAERDAMLIELQAAMTLADADAPPEELVIDHAGRILSVAAYLTRFAAPTDLWGAGLFRWAAEWVTDDPLRYGPPVARIASFPANLSGLVWPLFPGGVMDWGAASTSNLVTVSNSGNAAAPVQIEVSGPIDDAGFDAVDVATGRGLTFEAAVVAGSRVLLDGATGNVLLDGEFDRGDVLTSRYWPVIPKGGSLTLAFLRRGSDMGGAPSMTVTVRPAFW